MSRYLQKNETFSDLSTEQQVVNNMNICTDASVALIAHFSPSSCNFSQSKKKRLFASLTSLLYFLFMGFEPESLASRGQPTIITQDFFSQTSDVSKTLLPDTSKGVFQKDQESMSTTPIGHAILPKLTQEQIRGYLTATNSATDEEINTYTTQAQGSPSPT